MIPAHFIHGLTRTAAVMAMKARFLSQMGPLQSFLASRLGPVAGSIAASTLAGAAAAAYIAQKQGKSQSEIERAAAENVGRTAAREIAQWVRDHLT